MRGPRLVTSGNRFISGGKERDKKKAEEYKKVSSAYEFFNTTDIPDFFGGHGRHGESELVARRHPIGASCSPSDNRQDADACWTGATPTRHSKRDRHSRRWRPTDWERHSPDSRRSHRRDRTGGRDRDPDW